MRLGFALPQFDFSVPGEDPLRFETVARYAIAAEDAGFDSVWLADHPTWSVEKYGGPATPSASVDPLVALAALARTTTRVRLGVLVLCAPLRPPAVLAKALASLDVLCGGRLEPGFGAGWYEPDFAAAGVPFGRPRDRLTRLAETLDVARALLGGGPASYDGSTVTLRDAPCRPPSPQAVDGAGPTLWVGGKGDRLLELVARHADGWNTVWSWTTDAYVERSAALDAACEREGRDPASVRRSVGLFTLVGTDEADVRRRWDALRSTALPGILDGTSLEAWRVGKLVGTVEQVREQVAAWRALGVDELIVCTGSIPFGVAGPVGAAGDEDLALVASACSLDGR